MLLQLPVCLLTRSTAISHSSLWELRGKVTLWHFHVREWTNWWIESQHPARLPLTASKYSSNPTGSWPTKCITKHVRLLPPSAFPNLLNHHLGVHLYVHSITASKCITKYTQLPPWSASPTLLDYGQEVRLIMASKCISKHARSCPRSVSLGSLDCHFQVHLELLSSTACSQSRYTGCRWVAI